MDASNACTHAQSIEIDSRRPENKSEHVRRPKNGCIRLDSPGRSPEPCPEEPKGPRNHADASGAHMHSALESIRKMAARRHEDVRETPDKPKPPNTPIGTKSWCRGEADGLGNHTDESTARMDIQRDDNDPKTTKYMGRKVRTSQLRPRTQNSPLELEIEMVKHPKGWKHVH